MDKRTQTFRNALLTATLLTTVTLGAAACRTLGGGTTGAGDATGTASPASTPGTSTSTSTETGR